MTDDTQTTPTPPNTLQTLTQDLQYALDMNAPMDALREQIKTLHDIHTIMIEESHPAGKPFTPKKHDVHRLSLALRAQNQFCRSLLLLDHLGKQDKIGNELSKS